MNLTIAIELELKIRLVHNFSFHDFKYLFYRLLDSASRGGHIPPSPLHAGYVILSQNSSLAGLNFVLFFAIRHSVFLFAVLLFAGYVILGF